MKQFSENLFKYKLLKLDSLLWTSESTDKYSVLSDALFIQNLS